MKLTIGPSDNPGTDAYGLPWYTFWWLGLPARRLHEPLIRLFWARLS